MFFVYSVLFSKIIQYHLAAQLADKVRTVSFRPGLKKLNELINRAPTSAFKAGRLTPPFKQYADRAFIPPFKTTQHNIIERHIPYVITLYITMDM